MKFIKFLWMALAVIVCGCVLHPQDAAAAVPHLVTSGAHSVLLSHWAGWIHQMLGPVSFAAVADISTLLKEQYIDELPETFTKGDYLCNELMKAPHIDANTRAVVFNLEVSPGGDVKGMDFDGGTYPLGTNMLTKKPTVSALGIVAGWNVTSLMEWATRNDKLAIVPVLSKTLADMKDVMKIWLDCLLNAPTNDGVLDITLANTSGSTYSFDTVNSPFSGYLLVPGGKYDIYSANLLTKRANGPYVIDPDGGLDVNAATVTFTAAITGWVAGDRIVAQSLEGASLNSLAYHINGLTGLTWQSLSTDKIYARSQRVNGASNKLNGPLFRSLLNQILKFKGDPGATDSLNIYWPYEQAQNYESAGLDAGQMTFLLGQGGDATNAKYDLLLGEARVAKKKPLVGNHADPTKVFMFNTQKFRWIDVRKLTMKPNVAGGYLHPIIDTTLGTPRASNSMYMEMMSQDGVVDVTGMGVIDTLGLP